MSTLRTFILPAVIAIAASGCSMSANTTAADQGVTRFHAMLDAGQYADIYNGSSPQMKQAATEQDFVSMLDTVHRKLGTTRSVAQRNWGINYDTKGTFVTLVYKTTFSTGDADEKFVFLMQGQTPSLVGYHINSMAHK